MRGVLAPERDLLAAGRGLSAAGEFTGLWHRYTAAAARLELFYVYARFTGCWLKFINCNQLLFASNYIMAAHIPIKYRV